MQPLLTLNARQDIKIERHLDDRHLDDRQMRRFSQHLIKRYQLCMPLFYSNTLKVTYIRV